MNYIDYIKEHKDDINATCKKVSYKDIYKKSFDNIDNVVFKEVLIEFMKKDELERTDIFNEVEEGHLYKAFFMIILWGGIFQSNLNWVIKSIEEDDKNKQKDSKNKTLTEKLQDTSHLVNIGDIHSAFRKMTTNTPGNNRIKGINVSFLTKILYFFDSSRRGEKALIFDKWSKLEHCALIASSNENYSDYYHIEKSDKNNIKIEVVRGKDEYELYKDYIKRMNKLEVPAGKLEEFLFGYKFGSKQDKECKEIDKKNHLENYSNPRRFVVYYLRTILDASIGNTDNNNKKESTRSNQKRKENPKANNKSVSVPPKKNKGDKPIDNPTPLLYQMKAKDGGHYVLEEEKLIINSISLILARTKRGSHFCGFWNKDVPNTNLDLISEIQDIISNLSLSSLPWKNKPEYSRKYVMYQNQDSYRKAKELKDKISEYIQNMNE